ncbi:MAG: protein translocase subunit SecD [Patescibacteria group bacterium]
MTGKQKLWTQVGLIFALFLIVISFAAPSLPTAIPGSSFFAKYTYKLGLDLKGGAHLIYEADTSRLPSADKQSAINGVRDVIERRVNAFGISEPLVQTSQSGDTHRVIVELAGVFDVNEAIRLIGETPLLEFKTQNPIANAPLTEEQKQQLEGENNAIKQKAEEALKEALQPNTDFSALAKQYSEDPGSKEKGGDLGWAKRGLFVPEFDKTLFETLKVGETTKELVQTQFGYHIIKKIEERDVEGATKESTEKEVHAAHILFRTKTEQDIAGQIDPWVTTSLSGKQLKRASVQFSQQTGEPNVSLEFNDEGSRLFAELTGANIGKPIAIFLDGQPISVPTVQEKIEGGNAVITGRFNIKEARTLTERLNAGALPVPIHLIAQTTVGPTLGLASLNQSLRAGIIGILIVILFMILYYRLPGLIASFVLLLYASLVLALFKLIPVTLTLAGIAGFILSVGMAVDANILIFERLKEELKVGRDLSTAVEEGFKRAWTSIRDSNFSSLITCAILMWFGSSVIKGFAVTLIIGILSSMFTAITVSRTILKVIALTGARRHLWLFGCHQKKS